MTIIVENTDQVHHGYADFRRRDGDVRYVLDPGELLELALPDDAVLLKAGPGVAVRDVPAWTL